MSDDRLGDAMREIARAMTDNGKDRVRVTIVFGRTEAVYEVRLICARTRKKPRRERPKRVGGVLVVYPGER